MKLEDWHTHSALCRHAVGSIEVYIKKAIQLNLNTIGLSDHFPYEFLKNLERIPYTEYSMTLDEINKYLTTAEALREKYKDFINVRIAFEIDFYENQESALNYHLNKIKSQLDYILGSIHILNFNDGRGAWVFDDNRFRNEYDYYGADEVYLEYYKTVQKMIKSKAFNLDVIGHFDLPKKFNDKPINKELISSESIKALELIKKRGIVIEVNTSGLRKDIKEQYPSELILQEIYAQDIPILLGSDAHDPNEIAWEFNNIIKLLKKIGFNQLVHFNKRKKSYLEM
jgi:histidinol-phosphatase (PHP family)